MSVLPNAEFTFHYNLTPTIRVTFTTKVGKHVSLFTVTAVSPCCNQALRQSGSALRCFICARPAPVSTASVTVQAQNANTLQPGGGRGWGSPDFAPMDTFLREWALFGLREPQKLPRNEYGMAEVSKDLETRATLIAADAFSEWLHSPGPTEAQRVEPAYLILQRPDLIELSDLILSGGEFSLKGLPDSDADLVLTAVAGTIGGLSVVPVLNAMLESGHAETLPLHVKALFSAAFDENASPEERSKARAIMQDLVPLFDGPSISAAVQAQRTATLNR